MFESVPPSANVFVLLFQFKLVDIAKASAPNRIRPTVKNVSPVPPLPTDSVPDVIIPAFNDGIHDVANVPDVILPADNDGIYASV